MKIGDVYETAICAGCNKLIQHTFWGNGGNLWTHLNGRWNCFETSQARPTEGTIVKGVDE